MTPSTLIARKEAGELFFSMRGLAWLLALCGALSAFTLLLVGSTELSLLDNAQVVYDMAGLITALAALLALIVGIDATAGERERGSWPAPESGSGLNVSGRWHWLPSRLTGPDGARRLAA